MGISVDAADLRHRGIRHLGKLMGGQACAILCRIDDHPARNPLLLLLAQALRNLFALSRSQNVNGFVGCEAIVRELFATEFGTCSWLVLNLYSTS
jgi:hypothetical protein